MTMLFFRLDMSPKVRWTIIVKCESVASRISLLSSSSPLASFVLWRCSRLSACLALRDPPPCSHVLRVCLCHGFGLLWFSVLADEWWATLTSESASVLDFNWVCCTSLTFCSNDNILDICSSMLLILSCCLSMMSVSFIISLWKFPQEETLWQVGSALRASSLPVSTVSSVSLTDWDYWDPTESIMSAISCNERCCLLVIFNFFSHEVETVAIGAAGRLSDIVYVSWLLKRDVCQAKSYEWSTWWTTQDYGCWLQIQLYIAIAMATVQSPMYLMVLARMDNSQKLPMRFYLAMKQCFTCTGELQQTTSAKMNVVSSYKQLILDFITLLQCKQIVRPP